VRRARNTHLRGKFSLRILSALPASSPGKLPLGRRSEVRKFVTVKDKTQKGYRYELVQPEGRNFAPDFQPELSPKAMLQMGVFCGKYLNDCRAEFPEDWFAGRNSRRAPATVRSTTSELMQASHCRSGAPKAG